MLKPALRRLWRDPGTVQFGIDPRYAVVLSGVDLGDASLLDLMDGSRDLAEFTAEADRRGHDAARVEELMQALQNAAVLDDGPAAPVASPAATRRQPDLLSLSLRHRAPGAAARVMARREATTVEVLGAGRIGATTANLLAAAGVGQLVVSDPGAVRACDFAPGGIRSLGSRQSSRAEAARATLGGAGADRVPPSGSAVVLAPVGSIVPPEWLTQVRHRPHLPVLIRETTALIGPLVLPGRSPCLRCVELTRGDRDPAWPVLAAQLIGQRHSVEACDIALASAAASIAALHLLAWLDHGEDSKPSSVGGVLELSLADLRLRRRTVSAHPGCGCGAIDATPLPDG